MLEDLLHCSIKLQNKILLNVGKNKTNKQHKYIVKIRPGVWQSYPEVQPYLGYVAGKDTKHTSSLLNG